MQATATKKWKGQGRFDRTNSMFKHIITIYSQSKQAEIDIPGYSKGLLNKEMYDKIACLEGEIGRFVDGGYLFGLTTAINKSTGQPYLDRTIKMEFHLNGNYTGQPDELLFTLYPDRYEFANNQDFVTDIRLNTFLKRLYDQAKQGKFVTKSLYHKPIQVKEKDLFDATKKRFKNDAELLDWMQARIREGHSSGIVFDYYVKYSARWMQ